MAKYKQTSFAGGLNLLLDDTRLPVSFKYKEGDTPYDVTYNQYRIGKNIRTRFDICSPIQSVLVDNAAPNGIKQDLLTFGNYIIIFVGGLAYYRLNTATSWTQITGFSMHKTVPRYWTIAVPLNTTLYARASAATSGSIPQSNANAPITQVNQTNFIAATFGNNPGLLVQDGVNQPQFIFLDPNNNGAVTCRTTQSYNQWTFPVDPTTLQLTGPDNREYVPIGTYMEWFNGILFVVAPDLTNIYRSVSGRPLDFVINVDQNGQKGGDATTTSFSVGVSGISAMRAIPGNTLFVAAGGGICFSITLNTTANAQTIFGEPTFIRTIMFNANCITERGMVDIPNADGTTDSLFIDANGLRSFAAISQLNNEGRNSVFSSAVQGLFTGIFQSAMFNEASPPGWCSAINFDNYAIFSVNTTMGYLLVVYDTINKVYASLDTEQLGNHAAKKFAAITIGTLALYAITDDDRVVQLYAAKINDVSTVRLGAVWSQEPEKELKLIDCRAILSNITQDCSITATLFINNRLESSQTVDITYVPPQNPYTGTNIGNDINTMTIPIRFPFPNSGQGWKAFVVLSWNNGASLNAVSISTEDITPMQSLKTQAVLNYK